MVIGSRGFIGSHCVDYFSKSHEVWVCDIIMDYNVPNYMVVIGEESNYSAIFKKCQFDVCINCSGAARVPFSMDNPYVDFSLNTQNVLKFLEVIRKYAPECKFITLSSAAVYGNPQCIPITEETCSNPVSPYGFHKNMSEIICREYSSFWNVKTCCLRIFSAYGPR